MALTEVAFRPCVLYRPISHMHITESYPRPIARGRGGI